MSRLTAKALIATALVPLFAAPAAAQDYGNFEGETLRVKLIGGAQYEPLYAEISEWEELTGATVEILSRKNHFELDREIKQDIAARTLDWCVGSNHTSFAPQYGNIYADLNELIDADTLDAFVPLVLEHSTVDGRLVQLPRHSDVSNMFYVKSLFEDEENKAAFKEEYGYDLAPPETWAQVSDQAKFFANPPDFYGTQFVGKDEAVVGRFYELLVAEGGQLFTDDWEPAFNSEAGLRALNWFVDLYNANAVPRGVPNYLWDDTGLGFASGTVALNLDWAGWSAFFNDPENSKVAGDVGLVRAPKGSSGKRTGWSGTHSFSITEACENKEAAASFVTFLTDHERQMIEARTGLLPTRTSVWDDAKAEFAADGRDFMVEVFDTFSASMSEDAFTPPLIPEWIEVSNELWPRIQAAMLGDMTSQEALDEAARDALIIMEDAGYR
ncbi:sugar ABC transporter substrate-binding protein [Maritimibacter sp. HL-12]|jgi:multiple sugar transport system substrate-binding protein|uniref:ABC transporter substrate-binding protein n=1 Tax=Maritimibacter sp. HL-12 TaxID=1162418 RepID=UPI000A0F09F9|nr:sugar ABC transporter substrate-binding protein [Maritimibacter sp. HL-12]SMH46114.1 carbohydrate ABC transporter substrate-binding protein, CUT1 family (TC 3.A.1.1.-) [Maritimibacter sp. HL-12]